MSSFPLTNSHGAPPRTTTPRLPGADAAVNADAPKKAVPAMPQFSSQSLRSEFWEQK